MNRSHYIDNLKWLLIILVIFHHAGQAFGPGGDWGYHPSNTAEIVPELWRYFSLNAGFLMGLFFMVSGYFTPQSYDKGGFLTFAKKKLIHIGIPFIFLVCFMTVLSRSVQVAHGWYLFMLLFFSFLYGIYRVIFKKKGVISSEKMRVPHLLFFIFVAVILAISEYITRCHFPQDTWVGPWGLHLFEPAHLPQYSIMYILGIISYRKNIFETLTHFTGIICLAVAGVVAALVFFYFPSFDECNWWLWESVFCVSVSFGLVYFLKNVFNFSNRFTRFCTSVEYGAYIFHLTNMLVIEHIFDKLYLGGGVPKLIFIGLITTLFTFGVTYLIKLIPCVKKII